MICKDIFTDNTPCLSVSDSAQRALHYMDFFRLNHLPLKDEDGRFLGLITDEMLLNHEKETFRIDEMDISGNHHFVYEYQHIYDANQLMTLHKLSLIAVVDEQKQYLGCITWQEMLDALSKIISIEQAGSIIVLEMPIRDYALSQIAKIAEDSDIKIISSYIQPCPDRSQIKVTLKLNKNDVNAFSLSLERFKYKIVAIFSENKTLDEMQNERYEALLHYINI